MIEFFLMLIAGFNGTEGPAEGDIHGEAGVAGCSGNPNPPTDVDIWNYEHGQFTSRQDDIRIGSCYSPENMAVRNATTSEIIVYFQNGTQIILLGNSTGVYLK